MYYAIDVSKWQGTVNWASVKAAGVRHALLRAGYGNGALDPQFQRNADQCAALGVDWGCYWYSYAASPAQARQEARRCLQVIQGLAPTMPVAYDIECEPCILALDNATRTAMVKAFLGEIEAAGYYGILYASRDFIANRLNWRELAQYDVWCAQYGSACTCPLPYGIWQYSSSNPLGIPGYGKSLDCNRVYKDYPQIIQDAGLNGWAASKPDKPASTGDTSVPDASGKYQLVTIGPVSSGDAMMLMRLCEQLQLTGRGLYKSAWADKPAGTQTLTIGPVSSGDAWRIMRECEALELTDLGLYRSQYVEV